MRTLFVNWSLLTVCAGRRPDFTCTQGLRPMAAEAWADLKWRVVSLMHNPNLPNVTFHRTKFMRWWANRLDAENSDSTDWQEVSETQNARYWQVLDESFLTPLPPEEECMLGRWAAWLLFREFAMMGNFFGTAGGAPLVLSSWSSDSPSPLDVLLLSLHESDTTPHFQMPSWSDVAAAGWGMFGLLARMARVYRNFAKGLGVTSASWSLADLYFHIDNAPLLGPYARFIAEHAGMIHSALGGRRKRMQVALEPHTISAVEEASRRFASNLAGAPPGEFRTRAITTFLLLDTLVSLFDGIDTISLAEVVLLQMPRALAYHAVLPGLRSAKASLWTSGACGRFPHCETLQDADFAQGASSFASRPEGLSMPWRCGVAVRVPQRRSFLSDHLRATCQLNCARPVLDVLLQHSRAYLQQPQLAESTSPLVMVDVGANLGDCLLAAAALLPEGRLRGIAFEPDEESATLLQETVVINRLRLNEAFPNSSSIDVRQKALTQPALMGIELKSLQSTYKGTLLDPRWSGCADANATAEEFPLPAAPWHPPEGMLSELRGAVLRTVETSTLDHELAGLAPSSVDFLVVFANNMELEILQGASSLLATGSVRCALVVARGCAGKADAIMALFEAANYKTEFRGDDFRGEEHAWIAASPKTDAATGICEPNQKVRLNM